MIKLEYNSESIQILKKKKKLFGGIKEETVNILLDDIDCASKEIFNDILNSVTIFLKNGQEEFIVAEELDNSSKLYELFEFLLEKRNEHTYKLKMMDIKTLKEQDL